MPWQAPTHITCECSCSLHLQRDYSLVISHLISYLSSMNSHFFSHFFSLSSKFLITLASHLAHLSFHLLSPVQFCCPPVLLSVSVCVAHLSAPLSIFSFACLTSFVPSRTSMFHVFHVLPLTRLSFRIRRCAYMKT